MKLRRVSSSRLTARGFGRSTFTGAVSAGGTFRPNSAPAAPMSGRVRSFPVPSGVRVKGRSPAGNGLGAHGNVTPAGSNRLSRRSRIRRPINVTSAAGLGSRLHPMRRSTCSVTVMNDCFQRASREVTARPRPQCAYGPSPSRVASLAPSTHRARRSDLARLQRTELAAGGGRRALRSGVAKPVRWAHDEAMFDVDALLSDLTGCVREDDTRLAAKEVLDRALLAPAAVADALAPTRGGLTLLHH